MENKENLYYKPLSPGQFLDVQGIKLSDNERQDLIERMEQESKDMATVTNDEQRFRDLLLQYGRPGTDELLKWLKRLHFFSAPASVTHHNNFKGGLVKHSLAVYDCAIKERQTMIDINPELESTLPLEEVAVSALLHDVCKMDEYEVDSKGMPHKAIPQFPLGGHGDKSVIYILKYGFKLFPTEILAIKWHMGSSHITDPHEAALCKQAMEDVPLCKLICKADYNATH